ncbi:MAG: hypothetical protein K8S25_07825 [Alphaproteobacteria bacterium]|nr:hypothetical protein [Alphaproteobacteria bacterium]
MNDRHAMQGAVIEAMHEASAHHLTDAARPLRERIEALCPLDVIAQELISVAPVTFRARTFDIDEAGHPAILIMVKDEFGEIEDLEAFAPDPPYRHALTFGRGVAIGLGAFHDMRFHERLRLAMHASVWSYLGARCRGLLPLKWNAVALELVERRVAGIVAPSVAEGREIERRLARALKPPDVFITQHDEAA